jgi:hypothetical protein
VAARLPAYAVAYLAYRAGYAALAAESLGATDDGRRFGELAGEYTRLLRRELTAAAASRWSA